MTEENPGNPAPELPEPAPPPAEQTDQLKDQLDAIIANETPPVRNIAGAFVNPTDGSIVTKVLCGNDQIPPGDLLFIEGEYDPDTEKFDVSGTAAQQCVASYSTTEGALPPDALPVVPQTEMELIYTASVVSDGVDMASITGIPVGSRFYMSTEGKATPVDDGELTITFDTPGTYTFKFLHQGWLDTTITIEAIEP